MQYTISAEDMNVILKGLAALPLGESMNTFQRLMIQVQKQQQELQAATVASNGSTTSPN